MVRTSGNWLRAGNALVLDDTAFAGLEYTLPANWKQLWMTPLPAWLQSLTLKKFSASRNLIIDVDPAFPWQITALDGYGGELQLVKNGSWGSMERQRDAERRGGDFQPDRRAPPITQTERHSLDGQYH